MNGQGQTMTHYQKTRAQNKHTIDSKIEQSESTTPLTKPSKNDQQRRPIQNPNQAKKWSKANQ